MNRYQRIVNDWAHEQTADGSGAPARVIDALDHLFPKRRPAKKLAPGNSREERRAERNERAALIRSEVFLRAGGRCEFCVAHQETHPRDEVLAATEWHHCVGGGLRRYREGVETTAAICVHCHRGWEAGDLSVLAAAKAWAERLGFRAALRAIEHRLSKLSEARTSQGGK